MKNRMKNRKRRTRTDIYFLDWQPLILTTANDVAMKITVDLKNIDVPNEVDGNPPEKGIGTAVTAGPETMTMIPAPKKNTIVSAIAVIMKRTQMEKHLAQKY